MHSNSLYWLTSFNKLFWKSSKCAFPLNKSSQGLSMGHFLIPEHFISKYIILHWLFIHLNKRFNTNTKNIENGIDKTINEILKNVNSIKFPNTVEENIAICPSIFERKILQTIFWKEKKKKKKTIQFELWNRQLANKSLFCKEY
jgi:hypothetical protein